MCTPRLGAAQRLKLRLLSDGLTITPTAQAYIDARNGDRPMTPADYASTSGVILELDGTEWVNAPIELYNPNFVHSSPYELVLVDEQLAVVGNGTELPARMWLPPRYHQEQNSLGEAYTSYAFTHADRVRISPIEGCSMTCKFCNLPYDFRYRTKRVEGLVDAVRTAVQDPLQPAHHVLISGGTPRDRDIDYVRAVYEAVITGFPNLPIDIMMVPVDHLMDPAWLAGLGVNELSVNLEIYNREIAHKLMRRKANQGLDTYLDYLERAADLLGRDRVRSMLMVGLEPMEDTLRGVEAIAQRGAVPVLSPFRPDAATPLRDRSPSSADELEETYLRALEITDRLGQPLGPSCIPCSHNTLTLAGVDRSDRPARYGAPFLI